MPKPVVRPAAITPLREHERLYRADVVDAVTEPTERVYRLAVGGASDADVRDAMQRLPRMSREKAASIDRAVIRQSKRIHTRSGRIWSRAMKGTISEDLIRNGERVAEQGRIGWMGRNRRLLRQARTDQGARLRRIAADDRLEGPRLRRALRNELGIQRRRVRTIAVDQTEKRYGEESMNRQLGAGIDQYVWITREDDRVRPAHVRLHGDVRHWAETPRPGEPIRCRCVAAPNVAKRSA